MAEEKKFFTRKPLESIGTMILKDSIDPFDIIFVNGKKMNIQLKLNKKLDDCSEYELLAYKKN